MHSSRVVAPKPKVLTPGNIVLTPFLNLSQFPFAIRIVPDVTLTLPPAFQNKSTITAPRITTGTDIDIILSAAFDNVSTFNPITVSVAPPDGTILIAPFTNVSTFKAITVSVALSDGTIRLPAAFSNESTFGAITVYSDDGGGSEDTTEGIATDFIGDMI